MEVDSLRSLSMRPARRADRSSLTDDIQPRDSQDGLFSSGKVLHDPMRMIWQRGCARLILVSAVAWVILILTALLFHVWSCHSEISFVSAICRKDSKILVILDSLGFAPKAQHRCPIPLADNPDTIVIPDGTLDVFPNKLSYALIDNHSPPLFGGHQSWSERKDSFKLSKTMKVHCGFIQSAGGEMDPMDVEYAKNCRFVVASGIFDVYDTPHQPANISNRSQKLFCFLMVVDEASLDFIEQNVGLRVDKDGGKWVGIWRIVTLRHTPYDEPRRNGKIPKILTHRLFPRAQYSIWIDGKMELIVDPLLILERLVSLSYSKSKKINIISGLLPGISLSLCIITVTSLLLLEITKISPLSLQCRRTPLHVSIHSQCTHPKIGIFGGESTHLRLLSINITKVYMRRRMLSSEESAMHGL